MFSLENKNILITGATAGIGYATAVVCAKLGATLICVGRNEDRMRTLSSELAKISSKKHIYSLCDISKENEILALVKSLDVLDGAVFCAGINNWKPIPFIKEDVLRQMFDINTMSPILLTKEFVKQKKLKDHSSLVFVSSVAGIYTSSIGNAMYATTKGALQSFMKTAALELSLKGIRCNSVNPGRVETDLILKNTQLSEEEILKDKNNYPLKRYGKPEEIANAIVFLLSDEATWITGSSIVIDGGLTLK